MVSRQKQFCSNNTWVIVGKKGYIASSYDGKKWKRRSAGIKRDFNGVTYSRGRFIAVCKAPDTGSGAKIWVSDNNGQILISGDRGDSFQVVSLAAQAQFATGLALDTANGSLLFGTTGASAWELDGIDEHVILTDSLSKRVSMCGARVGWVVTRNREVRGALLRQGQARLCPPTLGQYVGAGLADVPASYMNDVLAEYQRRRDVVYDALAAVDGVTVRRPEGAFYLCARLPVDNAERFAEFLLRDFDIDGETTMIAPADGFYATEGAGVNEVRLAYVLETERLQRAMNVLVQALAVYPGAARAD